MGQETGELGSARPGEVAELRLRSWRRRRGPKAAVVRLDGDELVVHVPVLWGATDWRIRRDAVAFRVRAGAPPPSAPASTAPLVRPARLLNAMLRGNVGRPNLVVLFSSPQAMPPFVRMAGGGNLGVGRKESRDRGVQLDGFSCEVVDVEEAATSLRRWGAREVQDVSAELARTIGTVTDPVEADRIVAAARRKAVLTTLTTIVLFGSILTARWLPSDWSLTWVLLGVALLARLAVWRVGRSNPWKQRHRPVSDAADRGGGKYGLPGG